MKRGEIIIVEDGSVDRTVEIYAEYATRYPDQVRLWEKGSVRLTE